ncbi:MAG: LLM class F420-dependent oxidoreductase [Acidimicrobiia bacterium]
MKLATTLPATADPKVTIALAHDLDSAGIDAIWVAELYSFDAISILGYLAARTERAQLGTGIASLYSRTPTLTAMTAAGLDAVSDGRFVLGLGASGPQVIEGWHGVPYDHPIERTREVVEICRKVWRREPVVHDGTYYRIPLPPDEGTGLGKPLKLINRPVRAEIPIYIAALGTRNLQLTAEIADGWLPHLFHPDRAGVWSADLDAGFARRSPELGPLEIVADVCVALGDGEQLAFEHARRKAALYVGGMGAKGSNFYNSLFQRYGYVAEAETIQELYLSGRKEEAEAAVPDDFVAATTLAGDEGRVRERLEVYTAAGVTCLDMELVGPDPVSTVDTLRAWIGS